MAATIYYDNDADLSLLKDKTIAILGYGSQGHAQAQNLRDSGCNVIIGQRPGSANYDLAVSHGFEPMSLAEATKKADLINILLPDEVQGDLYREQVLPNLEWDLKNAKGIPVASGVYLIHVAAEGIGERTLKWFGINRKFDPAAFQ